MKKTRGVVDVCLSLLLFYLGVWLYELGNFMALALSGMTPSLNFAGALPLGVSAVFPGMSQLVFVKPLQVLLSSIAALSILYVVKGKGLLISQLTTLTLLSLYLASFYWEFLSLVGPLPLALHEVFYILLSMGALAFFTRADSNLRGLIW